MTEVLGALHFILIVVGVLFGIGCILAAFAAPGLIRAVRESRRDAEREVEQHIESHYPVTP